jgi:hypothetical protein
MKLSIAKYMLSIGVLTLLLTVAAPFEANAQGRGQGRGSSGLGRKCEKFVNCHDARDGRWDGRGPRNRELDRDRSYTRHGRNRYYNNRNQRDERRWRTGERGHVRQRRHDRRHS